MLALSEAGKKEMWKGFSGSLLNVENISKKGNLLYVKLTEGPAICVGSRMID